VGFAPQAGGGGLFTWLADRLPPRAVIAVGLLTRAAPGLIIGLWPTLPVPVMLTLVAVAATVAPVFSAALSGVPLRGPLTCRTSSPAQVSAAVDVDDLPGDVSGRR
jgi:hypothetical protein